MTDTAWSDASAQAEIAAKRLRGAIGNSSFFSATGWGEWLFAKAFSGIVYTQIWEDPKVDMEALAIEPGNRIVTIASGGCNALSYLLADPASVEAVDLNPTHVAFNRLKKAALLNLPSYAGFRNMFGGSPDADARLTYHSHLRRHLDEQTRAYWDGRFLSGRSRLSIFERGLYRNGLLGHFIGMGHRVAKFFGVDPRVMLTARTMEEQRALFDRHLAPVFEKRLVKWATKRKSSLYGLGIPPQQYDSLATSGDGMAAILRQRLETLACDFPLSENYFAWQAFGREYGASPDAPVPPYLERDNFETVKARAGRLTITNASYGEFLSVKPAASVDRFILLDAQDWMSDAQLNDLWMEITRAAAPGARVIFRTAAPESVLTGRLDESLLERWDYREEESLELYRQDRSSIYGGFHLYILKDARQ
jgi:S-adenosylmethionine-diacylglycerol 3-amino-3-carboxypropyl transferase